MRLESKNYVAKDHRYLSFRSFVSHVGPQSLNCSSRASSRGSPIQGRRIYYHHTAYNEKLLRPDEKFIPVQFERTQLAVWEASQGLTKSETLESGRAHVQPENGASS